MTVDREELARVVLQQLEELPANVKRLLGADGAANDDAELRELVAARAAKMRRARGGR